MITTQHSTHQEHILRALLADASSAALLHIAQEFGLSRIPGLSNQHWVERLLNAVPHDRLYNAVVATQYGLLTLEELLDHLLDDTPYDKVPFSRPRMDRIDMHEGVVLESTPACWSFTMRGHDVRLDLANQTLSCDCRHFEFASRYSAICKHIATAFRIIPTAYARPALIDLLVQRKYNISGCSWAFMAL